MSLVKGNPGSSIPNYKFCFVYWVTFDEWVSYTQSFEFSLNRISIPIRYLIDIRITMDQHAKMQAASYAVFIVMREETHK